jgi:hypothetical protein
MLKIIFKNIYILKINYYNIFKHLYKINQLKYIN